MAVSPDILAEILTAFRTRLEQAKHANPGAWERTRGLLSPQSSNETLRRLVSAIEAGDLHEEVKRRLTHALGNSRHDGGWHPEALKSITGLPPSKALRALLVLFGIEPDESRRQMDGPSPVDVEAFLREHRNPYDILLAQDQPSVLDLGAGDLSFAVELVDLYLPALQRHGRTLTVDCVERLRPGSKLGGRLQVNPLYAQKLMGPVGGSPPRGLSFRFFGDQDMLALDGLDSLRPRYTIVTCHGPATPTFAYEPTRVSPGRIEEHLRATKGPSRRVQEQGEEALEVRQGETSLLFPPWKFDVKGPLALLDVVARRGGLAVLGAIDDEVFWEILAQLLEEDRFRPPDLILTADVRRSVFGSIHTALMNLPIGSSVSLATLGRLRTRFPDVPRHPNQPAYRFRAVEIRRGAVFAGLPAGQTARLFHTMAQEAPPWFLVLVPELLPLN